MSNTTGIVIKIDAQSSEAAAKLQQFFNGVTGGLDKLTSAASFIEGLGAKIAGVFTLGAMVNFTRGAIDAADAMQKLSDRTGVAVTTLGALKQLGASRDLQFEQINVGLNLFNARLFAAAHQGGPVMQVFRDLGGGLDRLVASGASSDTVLKAVADRFKQLNDPQLLGFASRELFGRGGAEWVNTLKVGGDEITRIAATKGELADTANEAHQFDVTLGLLNAQFKSIWMQVAGQLLPYLKELADWLLKTSKEADVAGSSANILVQIFKGLIIAVDFVVQIFQTFGEIIGNTVAEDVEILANSIAAIIKLAQLWCDSFKAVEDIIMSLLGRLYILGQAMDEALHGHWKDARATAAGAATGLGDDFAAAFQRVAGNAMDAFTTVKDAVTKNFNVVKSIGTLTLDDLSSRWKNFWNRSLDMFDPAKKPNPFTAKPDPGTAPAGGPIISDEAQKLIDKIDKAYAEATKGKIALLNLEEQELKDKVDKEVFDVQKAEEEKTKITEIYSRKRTEIEQKATDERAAIAFSKTEGQRKDIESNPLLTDAQKAQALIPILQTQLKLTDDLVAVNERRVNDPALSDEARISSEKELIKLQQQQVELQRQLQAAQGQDSFTYQLQAGLTKFQNSLGTTAQNMANVFTSVFAGIDSGLQKSLEHFILYGGTLKQLFGGIYQSVAQAFAQSVSKMVADWIMQHIVMAAWSKLFTLQDVATHTAGETAKTASTSEQSLLRILWRNLETIAHNIGVALRTIFHITGETTATSATVTGATTRVAAHAASAGAGAAEAEASIPYVGPILAIAAMAAIFAAVMAMTGKFEAGGRPPLGQLALVGERGPELFIPDVAGAIIPAGPTAAMLQGGGSRAAGGRGAPGGQGGASNISVYGFTDPDKMAEHLQHNDDHEKWVVDVMSRHIHKFR